MIKRKELIFIEQKSEYQRLEIEVIDYEYEDVITTSGGNGGGQTIMPPVWNG